MQVSWYKTETLGLLPRKMQVDILVRQGWREDAANRVVEGRKKRKMGQLKSFRCEGENRG